MIFERTKNLKLSVIKQIEIEASRYPDIVSLAQGIPSFDTPECIKRRVENALKRGVVAKYSLSPGLPELRELIEINLAKNNMFYNWQNEIIVTAGSIQAITATILTITSPGDEVIIPEPTYTSYAEVIKLAGCQPVYVPLNEEKGWSFDIDKFAKAVTPKTKAIFYCNPNNPTGTVYTKDDLLSLGRLAKKHNLFLIADEVYKDFIYSNAEKRIFSLAEENEYRDILIRIFSFSKAYSMTGWRIGYLHTDESIASEILKVHDSLVTCAPVISQYAAMGALEMAENDVLEYNFQYSRRRDLICKRLDALNNIFQYIKPESSYFIFPKITKAPNNSLNFAMDLIKNIQVAVVPGFAFGPNGEGHVRMNFGKTEKEINLAFDRMEKYFK